MPFVRDWGAINPMTGIAAGVAGYMNAYKANANQSRMMQFQVDAQSAQQYGQALGNFLNPIALGGLGALAQNYGSNVNPQALVLAGSGIHPASVMNAPYGTVGGYATPEQRYGPSGGLGGGAGSAFQQQYGVDYSTAATLGKQLVGQGDVAAPYLQALGLPNAAAIQQLPAADQTGLYAQIGGMHRQMSAMTFQQAALQNAAEEKQYNMVKAGLDGGVLVGPPSAMQAYNNVRAAQERFVESRGGNVTPEQLAPFERQMRQVIRQAGFGAWNKKDPGPPTLGRDYSVDEKNNIVLTRNKDGTTHASNLQKKSETVAPQYKPGTPLPIDPKDGRQFIADAKGIPQPPKGSKSNDELYAELMKRDGMTSDAAWKEIRAYRANQQGDQPPDNFDGVMTRLNRLVLQGAPLEMANGTITEAQKNSGGAINDYQVEQLRKNAAELWQIKDQTQSAIGTHVSNMQAYAGGIGAAPQQQLQPPQQIQQQPVPQPPMQQPRGYKMEQVSQMPASKDKLVLNQTYTGGARPGVWRYVGLNDNGEPKFVKVTN